MTPKLLAAMQQEAKLCEIIAMTVKIAAVSKTVAAHYP